MSDDHEKGDALARVVDAMRRDRPVSRHALGVLRGRPGDRLSLLELAQLADENGIDQAAVAALFLVLHAGKDAAMWAVDKPCGDKARVSVWFAARVP